MRTRKEKPIFRGLTIAAVGSLGGSAQWSDTNIARWVGLREGRFVRDGVGVGVVAGGGSLSVGVGEGGDGGGDGDGEVTHVVCTGEEFRRAGRLDLYHLYRDRTFFQYEVVLTRDDEDAGIQGERYILSIFESNNASPHLYWFVVKYYKKKGDTQAKIHRPSHSPGIFAREFALFRSFFRMKTGIPWMQRLVKAGTTGNRVFQYQPPTGGKPVGWAPKEYIPTEVPNNAVMADVEVNTTASVPASANGNGNGNGIDSANLKTRPTIVTCPSAPASHRQSPSLITPARSPQPNQTMTVNPLPSQDETKAQHNPTASSSGTAPALGWPTGVDLPGAGNTNTVCAL
ncbi:hypothetical protein CHGG_05604 [Chaetomium globosum CBS 148.51]|uniref:Uncharacterized protein n=1 Tax=Chaetomium globosum (strain ATCC 6205 / CBS 148.51 / DSM 1962 / NBRC 6347 / NRRL 1970) TaxID=306901 RepID=Q2H6W1_CHAGB|nr:uncharacterized protein CHGG_05604 [Chaetomium globosum CBS 148.51]EAQ88985.1 hypothetical protein CHGG_05604 [Chaetomium globosum CBS 148.51]